jgi:3-phenylpropionate/trans-cinnamate dioxygenase ferredoxin reductase subunit
MSQSDLQTADASCSEVYGTLIVGTGQAAYQLASFLREEGYTDSIQLVGEEGRLPYQRPPLSKSYLSGDCEAANLVFQPAEYYRKRGIGLAVGGRVSRVDRVRRCIELTDSKRLSYCNLVLATGARNRQFSGNDCRPAGILNLRDLDDATRIRARLREVGDAIVIGAGFLGLEFAAVAAAMGVRATVVEAAGAVMARVVSAPVGSAFQSYHEAVGVRFLLGKTIRSLKMLPQGLFGIRTTDGLELATELVITSIGVRPNIELAEDAGLDTDNGIVVNEYLRTMDEAIYAIGDCAAFRSRFAPSLCRVESVQNAIDQARCLAKTLAGRPTVYDAVPWFWSDQGGLKLQIAGLSTGTDRLVVRGNQTERSFTAYCFRNGQLIAAESVARPADHMTARRLLQASVRISPEQVSDFTVDLKSLLPQATGCLGHSVLGNGV